MFNLHVTCFRGFSLQQTQVWQHSIIESVEWDFKLQTSFHNRKLWSCSITALSICHREVTFYLMTWRYDIKAYFVFWKQMMSQWKQESCARNAGFGCHLFYAMWLFLVYPLKGSYHTFMHRIGFQLWLFLTYQCCPV